MTVSNIQQPECQGVKGAIKQSFSNQLGIPSENVSVASDAAGGICTSGGRRYLETGSQVYL